LPIELVSIEEEPLRELDWYQQVIEARYLPRKWQRSLYYRLKSGQGFIQGFNLRPHGIAVSVREIRRMSGVGAASRIQSSETSYPPQPLGPQAAMSALPVGLIVLETNRTSPTTGCDVMPQTHHQT
jgi:hypothetical protein